MTGAGALGLLLLPATHAARIATAARISRRHAAEIAAILGIDRGRDARFIIGGAAIPPEEPKRLRAGCCQAAVCIARRSGSESDTVSVLTGAGLGINAAMADV